MVHVPMSHQEVEIVRESLKFFLKAEPKSILADLVDRLCNTAQYRTPVESAKKP
jgi:hypothetical protein